MNATYQIAGSSLDRKIETAQKPIEPVIDIATRIETAYESKPFHRIKSTPRDKRCYFAPGVDDLANAF